MYVNKGKIFLSYLEMVAKISSSCFQSTEITEDSSHFLNVRSRMVWYADHLLVKLDMPSDKNEYVDHGNMFDIIITCPQPFVFCVS